MEEEEVERTRPEAIKSGDESEVGDDVRHRISYDARRAELQEENDEPVL